MTVENITRAEAAAFLRLSKQTLADDVVHGRLRIPYYKVGRRVLYRSSELIAWLNARGRNQTPAAAK
jgi:excisionase family DNA binding protein